MQKGCGLHRLAAVATKEAGGYHRGGGRLGPFREPTRRNIAPDAQAKKPRDASGQRRFERILRSVLLPRLKPVIDRR
jgi:hypothetical protein